MRIASDIGAYNILKMFLFGYNVGYVVVQIGFVLCGVINGFSI